MTAARKGLFLISPAGSRPAPFLEPPNDALFTESPLYDLTSVDLDRYAGLVIDMHADQDFLAEHAQRIEAYMARGGAILFNGHVAYPMFRDCAPYQPLTRRGASDLIIAPLAGHPIFQGIDVAALGIRKGVRGFYGRGHNPMPPGARPITGIGPEPLPVDWVLERADGGRLFVHAGNDLWATPEEDATAVRIARNVWHWFAEKPAMAGLPA